MAAKDGSKYTIGTNRGLPDPAKLKGDKDAKAPFDADVEHIERVSDESDEPPPGRVKRARIIFNKHWRRFWCYYLLGIIIFLAIFLPIFFLIIIPAIAQLIVEKTSLPVHSAAILDPKPDRVSFSLHTTLSIPAGIKVHIDPINLTLFIRDEPPIEPYLRIPLHGQDLAGTTDITVTRNDTKILDKPDFIQVLTHAVYQKSIIMSAKGSTMGHLGALDAPLTLNKDIEVAGLDKFRGYSIESAKLLVPAEEDGTNLVGSINLPNHSVFTIEMGNITLDLKSEDLVLGQATVRDVVLRPGDNPFTLRGYLDIGTVLDNIGPLLATQREALQQGELQLSATGNSTIYNGNHIRYYEKILNDLVLTARVPIMTIVVGTLQGMMNSSGSDIAAALNEVKENLSSNPPLLSA